MDHPKHLEQEGFSGRVGILQRVLPAYRLPFFDLLARSCAGGLCVAAGEPRSEESIHTSVDVEIAQYCPIKNIHMFSVSSPFYLCWQNGLTGWLNDWQPDILVIEANPRYISTRFAANWMHARQRPVIGWGLGIPTPSAQENGPLNNTLKTARRPGRQRFLGLFDAIIAYSNKGAKEYRAAGFPEDKVYVAINAVSSKPVGLAPERQPNYEPRPTVLFVGRLQERKRIDLLLKACAALPAEIQPALKIVGEGPALNACRDLAEEIYPSARFTGALYGEELGDVFRAADLFVLPGTGGLAVQEAMTYGLPLIVAKGDGTQADLVHPENGWLVEEGDIDALYNTLYEALADPIRLTKMGVNSYRIVQEEVNIEMMAEVFIRAMQKEI
jgi:glycosyltransferase involved in cell wall biosynthesis